MKIRVAIIEDQKDTREMLAILVNGSEHYECVAAFETVEESISTIPFLKPDVVLVDIHLPKGSGIECVHKLKTTYPTIQFVMCTSLEDTDNIFNALQAGASGYLVKSTSPAKILEAIQEVYDGGAPMSSQIARKVVAHFHYSESKKTNTELMKLTQREQEILSLLSKGYRYKEISTMLFISTETVRKHIHNIYEKLQVNSRTDAINKAYDKI